MQFIVLGYDGQDDEALNRRLAVREAHLALFTKLHAAGDFLFGSAILDDEGKMIGSLIVCDFPSRGDLEARWLRHEPYVTGNVWQRIEIQRAKVPDALAGRRA